MKSYTYFICGLLLVFGAVAVCAEQPLPLDTHQNEFWSASGFLKLEGDVEGTSEGFGVLGAETHGGLLYFDTAAGIFDIRGHFQSSILTDDGGLDLPDVLTKLYADMIWYVPLDGPLHWRFGARPGVYSELSAVDDGLSIPFSVDAIYTFHSGVMGVLGFAAHPGFENTVDPRLGIRWLPGPGWVFDLFYPSSSISYESGTGWRIHTGFDVDLVTEYALDDERGSVMFDEISVYLGLDAPLSNGLELQTKLGTLVERSIEFDAPGGRLDIEDAYYLNVGVAAPF